MPLNRFILGIFLTQNRWIALNLTTPRGSMIVDIAEDGIALAGGGVLLRGFDQRIERDTGIRTRLVEDPLLSFVRGTATLLQEPSLLKQVSFKGI